jgi:hypothetical protein
VAAQNQVFTIDSPNAPAVAYIGGSKARATVALTVFGAIVAVLLTVLSDRWLLALGRSRASRSSRSAVVDAQPLDPHAVDAQSVTL